MKQSQGSQYEVVEEADGLSVVVRVRPSGSDMLLPAIMFGVNIFWAPIFYLLFLRPFFSSMRGPAVFFLLFFLAIVVVNLVSTGLPLLRALSGRDVVQINAQRIRVRAEVGPFGWTRSWSTRDVLELRPAPADARRTWGVSMSRHGPSASIAFDVGGKTARFASGVSIDEARGIAAAILRRFPALGSAHPN